MWKTTILDIPTKRNYTADMLYSLSSTKDLCETFAKEKPKLRLKKSEWRNIKDCLTELLPSKKSTLKMKREDLLPGDFFAIWRECKLLTGLVKDNLASKLVNLIEEREKVLLNNEALLASMFLDPRYLLFLDERYCLKVKYVLKRVCDNINSFNSNKTPAENSRATENTAVEVLM